MKYVRLLPQVVEITKEVGQYIKNEGDNFDRKKIEKKGLNDLVSYVDRTAEEMLVEKLGKLFPEAGFVAEEGTAGGSEDKEWTWIIDPLDGTTNFLHGLPLYSVSVALAYQKKVAIGVVYEPNRDECFYAAEGKGAFLNGEHIKVSETASQNDSLLATGFPFQAFEKMPQYMQVLDDFMKTTHGLRRMGSAAIDLAWVACGRFEGFFEYNLKPWDVAAGSFIVQQAGGTVTDFEGDHNFIYGKEIIAGCPDVHADMLKTIEKRWNS
ncbi:inositol monophosphatase [Fulvitalea axinellae]|uniref:Inositol-1-monophosphatase n=1 Tax=Fulvitalea axinellae TaxID=1182444 RepID=A0AAU9CLA4_9BACT|nr:inositol monophosphatase [Fulvitalea axinellae]